MGLENNYVPFYRKLQVTARKGGIFVRLIKLKSDYKPNSSTNKKEKKIIGIPFYTFLTILI